MSRFMVSEVNCCVAIPRGVDLEAAARLLIPEVVGAVGRPRGMLVEVLFRLPVIRLVARDKKQRKKREG